MASAPGEYNISSSVWTEVGSKELTKNFKVEWLKLAEIDFTNTLHLKNPLNSNKPVKISRDGQELPSDVAIQLINLIDAQPNSKEISKQSFDISKEKYNRESRVPRDTDRSVTVHTPRSDLRYHDRERRRDFDLLDMTYEDYLKSVKLHSVRGFTSSYLPVGPFPYPDIRLSPYIPFIPPRQFYGRDERDFVLRDAYYHDRRSDDKYDRRKRSRELIDESELREYREPRRNSPQNRNIDHKDSRKNSRRNDSSRIRERR